MSSEKKQTFKEILNSDALVGCNTVALYLGLLAKKSFTSIPKGFACSILQKIKYLRKFNE